MADKAQLKCNQGDIYPLCSLDNMVRSVSSSEAVSIPVLDSDGKIPTSYFPDDIGGSGTAETETDITSLGSAGAVVIEPGKAYVWDIVNSGVFNVSSVSSGCIGEKSYLRANLIRGRFTVTENAVIVTALTAGMTNDCKVEFRDGTAYIVPIWSGYEYYVKSSGTASNVSGTLAYGIVQGYKTMLISSGGAFKPTLDIDAGNALFVIKNTTVSLIVKSGGTARWTRNSGGSVQISSGGLIQYPLQTSGNMYVYTGGSMYNATINGGTLVISYGVATIVSCNGNAAHVSVFRGTLSSAIISAGSLFCGSLGKANTVNIKSGATTHIASAGTATTVTISSGGRMNISAGGYASGVTVSGFGTLYIFSGGTALKVSSKSGAKIYSSAGASVTYA